MQSISKRGVQFLEGHEGVVLKAYRDPVGIWTIGAGLTKASGVVTPKAGMTITRAEASRLLQIAIDRNYAPAVTKALGHVASYAFDGALSFHYNTGAISRASWVKAYKAGNAAKVRSGLASWIKGGGKVLPGLVRRRREEADIILSNKWPEVYRHADADAFPLPEYAIFVVSVSAEDIEAIRAGFGAVGFDPGARAGRVLRKAVEDFQRRYDLTLDGKIGKATLSTLQRELDGRKAATTGAGAAAAGGAAVGGGEVVSAPDPAAIDVGAPWITWLGYAALVGATLYLAWMAWSYRDLIAARAANRLPRLAAWLRSF